MPRISAASSWSSRKSSSSGMSFSSLIQVWLLEDETRVVASEAERVGERDLALFLSRHVGDVVEVALGVGRLVVDRGRDHSSVDREHAGSRLHFAGAAEQVPMHRLGG